MDPCRQLSSYSQSTNSSTSELSPFFEMDDYIVESMNCLPINSNTIASKQFPSRMVRIRSTKSSLQATPTHVFQKTGISSEAILPFAGQVAGIENIAPFADSVK
ncbi:hypothetical protein BLNAU_10659 [Blattamonas nauphoetae]|uniref:Uncharacterized protein n=1 Tax=Blattamonas nauphoetae TaxID=2049346 RepID=A0ABQ9XSR5_9EUKA|nr:hypothetical protein BLNAU_10659 [Blattamonas nauphoetae]